jgi:ribonuclease R
VQVSRVDLDGRRIDFRLIHEGEGLVTRGGKDKELPRAAGSRDAPAGESASATGKRSSRKISEPDARSPKSASKSKDPGRKPRRRS